VTFRPSRHDRATLRRSVWFIMGATAPGERRAGEAPTDGRYNRGWRQNRRNRPEMNVPMDDLGLFRGMHGMRAYVCANIEAHSVCLDRAFQKSANMRLPVAVEASQDRKNRQVAFVTDDDRRSASRQHQRCQGFARGLYRPRVGSTHYSPPWNRPALSLSS